MQYNCDRMHALSYSTMNQEIEKSKEVQVQFEEQSAQVDELFQKPQGKSHFLGICIIIAAVILGGSVIFSSRSEITGGQALSDQSLAEIEKVVIPDKGVILPIKWGDLGKQLVENGSIDKQKFDALYAQRGGLDDETKKLIYGINNGKLLITKDNANVILNLLWALGLANKNEILDRGPITDKQYGGDPGKFASTGGWTLATGNPMDHYSRHSMILLTPEQQSLVERTSKGIYRPCCGNSTYFPDCNHGMAILGLLELMASQGVSEVDMYKAALAVNSYWFPDTYLTIARYLKSKGIAWNKAGAKEILGANFSSQSGYKQILDQVQPVTGGKGSSCGA